MAKIRRGIAINFAPGYVRLIGDNPNKTDNIAIGPKGKKGFDADNDESIEGAVAINGGKELIPISNTMRIFSAQPILGGVSPSQLLYGGMTPDKVFAMQEQYKRTNRIADDGSRYKTGGQTETPVKKGIDWSGIVTTSKRGYNSDYIDYINNGLIKAGIGTNQRAAILANVIEESGGNPFAVSSDGKFKGILQWEQGRYWPGDETDAYKELDNQIKYIVDTAGNSTDRKSWTHGGKGSGYNSLTDAMAAYNSEDDLAATMRGYTLGYVRPAGGINSYNNRFKVAEQIVGREGFKNGGIYIKPSKRGTFTAAAKKHGMSVQAFASKVLANKGNYSSAMVKKANFAKNASKWHHHLLGGEDSLINPLGERPNAKLDSKMNKRKKALYGLEYPPYTKKGNLVEKSENLGNGFQLAFDGSDFSTLYDVNKSNSLNNLTDIKIVPSNSVKPIINPKPLSINGGNLSDAVVTANGRPLRGEIINRPVIGPNTPGLINPYFSRKVEPYVDTQSDTSPSSDTSATSYGFPTLNGNTRDLIGAGVNLVGSLVSAGINAHAINNLRFTPRTALQLNPAKLKTKINIAPQIAKMRETVAGLTDAARRTSASSRNAYQRIADARFRGLQVYSDLLGRKENEETNLINKDRLNQQQVSNNNIKIAMDTINTNIAGMDNLNNVKRMLRAQNGVSLANNIAGIFAGPQGLLARREARIKDANNLTIATLPYLEEFNTLSKDEFVKKHSKAIWNAIANGKSLVR